jgi:hypothetical protein
LSYGEALLFTVFLRAVFASSLFATFYALKVKVSANYVVAYTRKIRHTAAAYYHYGVFLKVMSFAAYICPDLISISQTHAGDLPKSRVRLLGSLGSNLHAHPSFKRRGLFVMSCL